MYAACSSTVTMVQLTISVYHTHVLHDTQLLQVLVPVPMHRSAVK